jgi:[NiFe] hydrogenase diaphorase moiety large subunit
MSVEPSTLGQTVSEIVQRHGNLPTRLLQILREVQDSLTWLSPEAMDASSQGGRPVPRTRCVGSLNFIPSSTPRRAAPTTSCSATTSRTGCSATVSCCITCATSSSVSIGQPRADGRVTVGVTSCTGMCDQGPAALVNGYALTSLDKPRLDRIAALVNQLKTPLSEWPQEFFEVTSNIRRADILLGRHFADGAALRAVLKRGPDAMLEELVKSGLRGQGGAGFKLALKWISCRKRSGRSQICGLQRRRGRAGHLQGSSADAGIRRSGIRGDDSVRAGDRRASGLRLPARRVPLPAGAAQGHTCSAGARSVCWARTSWVSRVLISTSTFISARALTSAAKNRR